MTVHVDLVRNDPHAGRSYVIARYILEQNRVVVKNAESWHWNDLPNKPMPVDGGLVIADTDAEEWLRSLRGNFNGASTFATVLHDDDECEYVHGEVQMTQLSAEEIERLNQRPAEEN
jgi:hypothetical protein